MTYIRRTSCRMPNSNTKAPSILSGFESPPLQGDCSSTSKPSSMRRMQRGMSAYLQKTLSRQTRTQRHSDDGVV